MSRWFYFLGGIAAGAFTTFAFEHLRSVKRTAAPAVSIRSSAQSVGGERNPHQPNHLQQIFDEFGFPGPTHDVEYRTAFVSSYDRSRRHPVWVTEHLTTENLKRGNDTDRGNSRFREDADILEKYRAKLSDYFRSGYDRGHMAPAADAKRNQDAMDETFFLTNISPQVGDGFNRDYWAFLEQFARDQTQTFRDVFVITGTLYLPRKNTETGKFITSYEVIGSPAPSVSVPTHFYKVLLVRDEKGELSMASFVLPNAPISNDIPLTQWKVPVEVIERASGLSIFEKVKRDGNDGVRDLCKKVVCELKVRKFDQAKESLTQGSTTATA